MGDHVGVNVGVPVSVGVGVHITVGVEGTPVFVGVVKNCVGVGILGSICGIS